MPSNKETFLEKLSRSRSFNLIVSVTRDCVLDCAYCYAKDPNKPSGRFDFSDVLLEKLIREAFDVRHKSISFEWTGGEPLLAGRGFYERVLELQREHAKPGKDYENIIQTSGAIYNENLYDFLIDNGFAISITIDGPRDIHNLHRPMCGENGSFDRVIKSFEYLREKQGYCGVLCTITKRSAGEAKNIFDFYRASGITSWHTNPYIFDGRKPVRDEVLGLTPEEYASFLIDQFERWLEVDDKKLRPSTIKYISERLGGMRCATKCSHGGRCLTNFINIDPDGYACICPKFLGFKEHRLGNMMDRTIPELISPENPRMSKYIRERLEAVNSCENDGCAFLDVCNSGCPYGSTLSGADGSISHRDILCDGKKSIYSHIKKRMENLGLQTIAGQNSQEER